MKLNTDSFKNLFSKKSLDTIRSGMMSLIDLEYYKNFVSRSDLAEKRKSMMGYLDKSQFKNESKNTKQ